MVSPIWRVLSWLVVCLAALSPALVLADTPARAGRLSLVDGLVTVRADRMDRGSDAAVNQSLGTGAVLETGWNGRTEIQAGTKVFRLAGDGKLEFSALDDRRIDFRLERGSLAVTLRDPGNDLQITTPSGTLQFRGPGRYRIHVQADGSEIHVTSWTGSAYFYRAGGALGIPAGRRGVVYSGGGWFLEDPRRDDFDNWVASRDPAGDPPQAERQVPPEMTGYEELEQYGEWSQVPDYGRVWYPRAVPPGWAPYSSGRWAWVSPWGWTWVDAAPWGYAPFYYGQWLFLGGRWGWAPGPYVPRPLHRPAVVGRVGGPGWSIGIGSGQVGPVGRPHVWQPLPPPHQHPFSPAQPHWGGRGPGRHVHDR